MVQSLHFASYTLSDRAWQAWFAPWYGRPRVQNELEVTFGEDRDVFADSGGFQLLHGPPVDLSRWGLEFNREDILELQLKYAPTRLASLDAPLPPSARGSTLRRLTGFSLENATWLAAQDLGSGPASPQPYLVVHGRSPGEVRRFLHRLETRLGPRALRERRCAIALGSQVPISGSPKTVLANAQEVLRWMARSCASTAPLHVFGVGDPIAAEIWRAGGGRRDVSYDNSTYVQNAFRLKVFDPAAATYRPYNPNTPIECSCGACKLLAGLGNEFVSEVMSAPAYTPSYRNGEQVNRSDVLAYVALHNLAGWRRRAAVQRPRSRSPVPPSPPPSRPISLEDYRFPVKGFRAVGTGLVLLPCSKVRPYSQSPSHQRVLSHLRAEGFDPGTDVDRITLSGFFGPVHWNDESLPQILGYDFRLTSVTQASHLRELGFRTASVLNVIAGKYESKVAYLRSPSYASAFGGVLQSFGVSVIDDLCDLKRALEGRQPLSNL